MCLSPAFSIDIGITKLTDGQEGFATGDGPHTYQLPGAPAGDAADLLRNHFSRRGDRSGQQRPGWFVNVTDDSWFGPWAGPYQHLLIARARAIEEALPVARAANTGISAVIDPFGRITAQLGLGKMGVLDARLPTAAAPSTYARFGDLDIFVAAACGDGAGLRPGTKVTQHAPANYFFQFCDQCG